MANKQIQKLRKRRKHQLHDDQLAKNKGKKYHRNIPQNTYIQNTLHLRGNRDQHLPIRDERGRQRQGITIQQGLPHLHRINKG